MTNYDRWLWGNKCGCGGGHTTPITGDNCSCEEIYLEISNLHTDINVVRGEVENKLDASAYTPVDLSDYYTKEEVDLLIPTNVSELVNDAGYLTEHQSLSGYATEQWVLDKNYITGVDLSNYALKSEIPTVPTNVSAFNNDAGYLTEHQHLKTINGQVISGDGNIEIATSGGSITVDDHIDSASTNPVENKAIYGALNGKLDISAYTPTDLSNYYNKQEVDNLIPTVPTSNSAFTNDMHYVTSAETANYVTSGNVETQITNHFYCCSENEWATISGNTQPNVLYLIY